MLVASEMSIEKSSLLTVADFEAASWREIIQNSPRKTCLHYTELFRDRLAEAEAVGDRVGAQIYRLLMDVTFMQLDARSTEHPFRARCQWQNQRSATPEDIARDDVALLKDLAVSKGDPEMRARLADISWVLTRAHEAAEIAITSYLASAKTLEDPKLPFEAVDRIERALRLAAQLRSADLMSQVADRIKAILDSRRSEFPFRLASGLLSVLSDSHLADSAKYANFAEEYATQAESQNDFETAQEFWSLKAKFFDPRSSERRAALIAAAETHVKRIDLLAGAGMPTNHMATADLLERAIHAHRSIPGQKERVAELLKRLLSIQPDAVAQMPTIQLAEIDVSETTQRAISRVRGKSFFEALVGTAMLVRPPEPGILREHAIENMNHSPFASSLPRVLVNSSGKTVAKTPSAVSAKESEREVAMIHAMRFELSLHRGLTATMIAAARSQVVLEHPVLMRDWDRLLTDNPFIPAGRERIFAEGLHAGLMGNLLVATHLLIPQFENSIRELLFRGGTISSKYNNDGIQEEKHTQELLYMAEFEQLFGPAITFDLKALLVDHGGPNLRHGTAHGLRSADQFSTADALYFWCRVLGFCIPDLLRFLVAEAAKETAEAAEN